MDKPSRYLWRLCFFECFKEKAFAPKYLTYETIWRNFLTWFFLVIKDSYIFSWKPTKITFTLGAGCQLKGPTFSVLYKWLHTINEIFPNKQLHNRYQTIAMHMSKGYKNLNGWRIKCISWKIRYLNFSLLYDMTET